MYYIFFIKHSVDEHLGFFYVLAIVNSVAMNTGVHVSFQIMVLSGYMSKSGVAESHGSYIFSFFFRNFYTVTWRRKWQPTPVFLPGESQRQGSLVGCRLWGRTESDITEVT